MSLLYSYATGSSFESARFDTVNEILTQIPDNTSNLIVAKDVRDAVFSLWERISVVEATANAASASSPFFQNPDPVLVPVGGIKTGTTFPTQQTLQQMFNQALYPFTSPGLSLSITSPIREYGAPLPLTLNWSVAKKSNNILTITVNGVGQTPTGLSQSGLQAATGTHSTNPPISTVNTFTMSVYDGNSTTNATASLTWMNKIYWGSVNLTSLSNPNLTTNPGSASLVGSVITSSTVRNLSGAGVSTGNELSLSKDKTYTGMNGSGNYLIFAWPSNLPGSLTPKFSVNGMVNTAFTRVRTNWTFTNQYGFSGVRYEVWISNTIQNSPLNIIIN